MSGRTARGVRSLCRNQQREPDGGEGTRSATSLNEVDPSSSERLQLHAKILEWALFILQHIHERCQQLVHALAIGLCYRCARCFGGVLGARVFQSPDRQHVRQ